VAADDADHPQIQLDQPVGLMFSPIRFSSASFADANDFPDVRNHANRCGYLKPVLARRAK